MVDTNIIIEKNMFLVNQADQFIVTKDGNFAVSIQKTLNPKIREEKFDKNFEKYGIPIDGILGMIEAKDTNYLLVIDKSTLLGTIMGHYVFQIDSVLPIPYSIESTNKLSIEDEFHINQIKNFLKRNTFYYSPTLDLSISMMKTANNSLKNFTDVMDSALFRKSVHHFIWNFNNTRTLDNPLLERIIHPVINGFITIKPINTYESEFTYCLISRKDTRRSGYRFIVRGADANGNVANFVETEQLLIITKSKAEFDVLSYVQIRGSIPLIWSQLPNLQLNPPIIPCDDYSAHSNAFTRHINQLLLSYDKVTIVNLIDKSGDQNIIGEFFQSLYQNSKTLFQSSNNSLESLLDFTWFDFHKQCKKMKYENISILLKTQSIALALSYQDFTHLNINKSIPNGIKVITIQKAVFRTNCIDNLDRTNVVQSVFARQFLHKMLYRLKLSEMPRGNPFEEFLPGFESTYKRFWGDNGDTLSKAYSGTKALKRDFTRLGKRTIKGAIEDGINTSMRFYINNFCDGYNQDCHDYYLGFINPKKKNFKQHSTTLVNLLIISVLILSILLYKMSISFSFPQEDRTTFSKEILKILIYSGILIISFLSLINGFKNSIIDLSTINYN